MDCGLAAPAAELVLRFMDCSMGSMAGLCLLYSSVSLSNACATFRWLLISMTLGWMRRRSRVANDRRSTCTAAATALANSKPTSNAVKELFLIDAGGTLLTALAACPICFLFGLPRTQRTLAGFMALSVGQKFTWFQ